MARLQRRQVRWLTGTPVAEAYRPVRGSLLARVRTVMTDSATWHDLAWLGLQFLAGLLAFTCLMLLAAGIHPPVLTERGLADAVEALALASAVPVNVDARLGRRLPARWTRRPTS